MLIVQKFGGSSLADIEKLRRAAKIVLAARHREQAVAVVVSAMGETTDTLLNLARAVNPAASARELDALMSSGEQQSAALLAMTLESMGAHAVSLAGWQAGMYTDDEYGDAKLQLIFPSRAAAALKAGFIPVETGFQGVNARGDVSTLGRGGSDTSAVALAAALGADRCEIYSDVNGIYTADPRLVPTARRLDEIDRRDMLLLSRSGSQVLHEKSVGLSIDYGMDITLLSSAGEPGYSVVRDIPDERRPLYAGVTRDLDCALVTLAGRGCCSRTLPELAGLLSDAGISVRGGRMGEGFAGIKVDPAQLIFALNIVHDYYFT